MGVLLQDAAGVNGRSLASAADDRPASKRARQGGMESVYICAAVRTPLGAFLGGLAPLAATDLGAAAIRAAVQRAGVPPEAVGEVYMGNVCSANLGQAPARQAALKAGLPLEVDCTTVNKVCSSGARRASLLGSQEVAGEGRSGFPCPPGAAECAVDCTRPAVASQSSMAVCLTHVLFASTRCRPEGHHAWSAGGRQVEVVVTCWDAELACMHVTA